MTESETTPEPTRPESCNECAGFKKLVAAKSIHLASGQMMDGQGQLYDYAYYWLGPVRKPSGGMMAQSCPCCGGAVSLTAKFLAHCKSAQEAQQ